MAQAIAKVKASTVIAVWETKIKLAEDVANARSQNLVGWHVTVAKLKGEPIKSSEDPEGRHRKVNVDKKTSGNDNQATVQACQTKL